MFSKFFIDRPIFASVLSIILVVAGAATMYFLPIEQYPTITPPTVVVNASYPGADASTIASLVGEPLEEQINGVENMLYMSSTSSSTGTYSLTITFQVGTDIDMATVLVENRVSEALSLLPSEVQELGVTTNKESTNIVLFVALKSAYPEFNSLYLANYMELNIINSIGRLPGVGSTTLFGDGDYSMRIWLKPSVLATRGLTPSEVVAAIKAQNIQVAAGNIGSAPQNEPTAWQYTINTQGLLTTPEEFGNIIITSDTMGGILYLRDIADIELGRESYASSATLEGKPTASMGVFQLPGANALDIAKAVEKEMENLSQYFPEGVSYEIPYNTTIFITSSIDGLYTTLFTAFILVMIVIWLFLQNWRALFIPMITIPVSLIGTFTFIGIMGFSINTLTLFGLVLAVGLVVDDAIVIVENSFRLIEGGKHKTIKAAVTAAMGEVEGAVIGIVLVLLSVFIPTAFIGGIPGELYKQFALTIAVATVISGFNALTLTPALCAIFIKEVKPVTFKPFVLFNKLFDKLTEEYTKLVDSSLKKSIVTICIFAILSFLGIWGFIRHPQTFIPEEDQGWFMVVLQLPNGATLQETDKCITQVSEIIDELPKIKTYITIGGYSMLEGSSASNGATMFVILDNWSERKAANQSAEALIKQFNMMAHMQIHQAECFAMNPPAIPGIGQSNGFQVMIEDINAKGAKELQAITDKIIAASAQNRGLYNVITLYTADVPQYYLNIDRNTAELMNLDIAMVFNEISAYLGSSYINNFVRFGYTYRVMLEGTGEVRRKIDALHLLQIKNENGEMVPLTTFATIEKTSGPELLTRYNTYLASSITGDAATGYSSGQGLDSIASVITNLAGKEYSYEWTGMAFAEENAGDSIILVFVLAIIMAYLILAAQYESWTSPVAVLMGLPISLLGVVIGCKIIDVPISIYTQIGIILLIALTAKNAILIVTFARDYHSAGKSISEAAMEGGRVRLRPILMTSFAFILGTFPLVIATGAGASARISLGIAVFAGMLMSSLIGSLFIPAFYKIMESIQERKTLRKD